MCVKVAGRVQISICPSAGTFPSAEATYCQKSCRFIGHKLPHSHKCNWNFSKSLEIKSNDENQTFTKSCTQPLFSQKTRIEIHILTAHSLVLNLKFLLPDCTGDTSLTTQVAEHCSHSVGMDAFLNRE